MKKKQPQLVTIFIFTTAAVVLWVFYSLYETLVKRPDISVPESIVFPLPTQLDTKTLGSLESRLFFLENQTIPLPEAKTP